MSAPKTNIEKQKSRHRPALIGIAVALIIGAGFFLLNIATVDGDGILIENTDSDAAPVPAEGAEAQTTQ